MDVLTSLGALAAVASFAAGILSLLSASRRFDEKRGRSSVTTIDGGAPDVRHA